MVDSLLAYVVKKYAPSQWENIATDSLHYLLRRPGVEDAFHQLVVASGLTSEPLTWSTQLSNADRSRPDLVGLDADGRPKLLVEIKFWASLAGNQPTCLPRQPRAGLPRQAARSVACVLWFQRRACTYCRQKLRQQVEQGC